MKGFAKLAVPLYELAADREQYVWNPKANRALALLKKCLSSPLIRTFQDTEKPFVVFVDAFQVAVGTSLVQKQPSGELHTLQYASRTLNRVEQKSSTFEPEAEAVIFFLKSSIITYLQVHLPFTVIRSAPCSGLQG